MLAGTSLFFFFFPFFPPPPPRACLCFSPFLSARVCENGIKERVDFSFLCLPSLFWPSVFPILPPPPPLMIRRLQKGGRREESRSWHRRFFSFFSLSLLHGVCPFPNFPLFFPKYLSFTNNKLGVVEKGLLDFLPSPSFSPPHFSFFLSRKIEGKDYGKEGTFFPPPLLFSFLFPLPFGPLWALSFVMEWPWSPAFFFPLSLLQDEGWEKSDIKPLSPPPYPPSPSFSCVSFSVPASSRKGKL